MVTRDRAAAGYSESLLECASSNDRLTPGRGLYNAVTGAYDHDGEANNEACAPARPRPIRIEKAGTQPVGTPTTMARTRSTARPSRSTTTRPWLGTRSLPSMVGRDS